MLKFTVGPEFESTWLLHFGVLHLLTLVACSQPPPAVFRSDAEVVQDLGGPEVSVDVVDADSPETGADSTTCGIGTPSSTPTWYDPWCMDDFCLAGGSCKFDPKQFEKGFGGCAVAPEQCPRSWVCQGTGRCEYNETTKVCSATADSCTQCIGNTCGPLGEYIEGQIDCVVTSPEHCKVACAQSGHCQFNAEAAGCDAVTKGDCLNSEYCRYFGGCDFDANAASCNWSVNHCQDTLTCKEWGLSCGSEYAGACSGLWTKARHVLLPDEPTPVVPPGLLPAQDCTPKVSVGFCPSVELCMILGLCGWDGQRCIPRDVHDCRLSTSCGLFGWCGVVGDRCGAVLIEDCVRCAQPKFDSSLTSIHCSRTGDPIMGRCVPQVPTDCWYDCSQYGHCTLDKGRCVATNDFACSWSVRCEKEGACVVDPRTRECAIPLGKP